MHLLNGNTWYADRVLSLQAFCISDHEVEQSLFRLLEPPCAAVRFVSHKRVLILGLVELDCPIRPS